MPKPKHSDFTYRELLIISSYLGASDVDLADLAIHEDQEAKALRKALAEKAKRLIEAWEDAT